jgi:uncharacterized protein DUF1206
LLLLALLVSADVTASRAERAVDRRATGSTAVAIGRVGFVARGAVYLMVGWLALLAAVGVGNASATDKQGALQAVDSQPLGTVLLIFVAAGLLAYTAWSVIRAVFDPERHGHRPGGVIARIGYLIAAVSYTGLGIGAAQLALGAGSAGKGSDQSTQDWTARLLQAPFGPPLVMAVGLIVLGVAVAEFLQACKPEFGKTLNTQGLGPQQRKWITRFGRVGMLARGIVFAMTGIFLIQAARHDDPSQAIGLGGALQKLAEQPEGPALLGLVAAGLCMYGLYSLAEAKYRRLKA